MNTNIVVPDQGAWPLQPYAPPAPATPGQRVYSSANILDVATFLRVVQHWRWLIIGAVALGFAGAVIVTLLTTPLYRSWVTLEANPPSVMVSDEQSRERQ